MVKILIAIVIVWLLWKIITFSLCLFEKVWLRGNELLKDHVPEEWKSEPLENKLAEAKALDLIFCGSYLTAEHTSIVKTLKFIYHTFEGNSIVKLHSSKVTGTETIGVYFITRFNDGTVIETFDSFSTPDVTGVIEKKTVYKVPIPILLKIHQQRILEKGKSPMIVSANSAFSILDQISLEYGERMVGKGYAHWVDSSKKAIKMTIKGAFIVWQAIEKERKQVISNEVYARKKGESFSI